MLEAKVLKNLEYPLKFERSQILKKFTDSFPTAHISRWLKLYILSLAQTPDIFQRRNQKTHETTQESKS